MRPRRTAPEVTRRLLSALARCGDRPHALACRVLDRLGDGFAPRSGEVRLRPGAHGRLTLSDNLQRTLYFTGRYEPTAVRRFVEAVDEGSVVVDVGANIGLYSAAAAAALPRGSGRVVAVEPVARTREVLAGHLADAGAAEIVHVAPIAFGEAPATMTIRANESFGEGDAGTATLVGSGAPIEEVEVVRGSDWLRAHGVDRIDVLKIDVEGSELAALRGLDDILRGRPPRYVQIEILGTLALDDRAEVFERLERLGLAGRWISARGERQARAGDARSGNAVFTPGQ